MADYSAAIKRAPENAHAYCRRGYAEKKLNKPDRALADYNKAIALQPKVGEFYRYRAELRFSRLELDKALLDADKALELNADDGMAHNIRGALLSMAAEMQGAMKGHNGAINLRGEQYVRGVQMNLPTQARNTLTAADEEFSKAIALMPRAGSSYANRGSTRFGLGRLDDALEDFVKASELQTESEDRANAYYFRGMIEVIQGKNDQALANLNKAIEINPRHASAYFYRAEARKALGDIAGSADDLRKNRRLK